MSEIEGKVTGVGASECEQRASFNRANGMSEIEGKVTRIPASEGGGGASFKYLFRGCGFLASRLKISGTKRVPEFQISASEPIRTEDLDLFQSQLFCEVIQ